MEELSKEQIIWVKQRFNEWLRIREQWQKKGGLFNLDYIDRYPEDQRHRQVLSQWRADIDHSALLDRLLSGKEAFPTPPPLVHSYPAYGDNK